MRFKNIHTAFALAITVLLSLGLSSCDDEELFEDSTFSSNTFNVLKVEEGANALENGETGISAFGLALNMTFSHAVTQSALESGLSVTGGANYSISLDATNSIATLTFDPLQYETSYTISLAAGVYGAEGAELMQDYSLSFTTKPFIIPNVSLTANPLNPEEGSTTSITAVLSESTTEAVVINLSFAGDATQGEDYTATGTAITVPVGETSASIELTLVDDALAEGTEIIEVSTTDITNGNATSNDPLQVSIIDNDVFTDLELKGVMAIRWSTEPGGNTGKAVHLRAKADIADLSVYSIGVANNGGGTDSIEFTLPNISVAAGEDVLLARELEILDYFGDCGTGFEHVIQTDAMNQNGDDAIELYSGTSVIETYGDVNVDGTGEAWEYAGSWGYKLADYWVYGGVDCAAASTTTQDSDCTYPMCANALQFQGVMSFEADPTNSGSTDRERAIHLRANRDIDDLSIYGIGIANNGGGSDGREMDLPAISVKEGDNILFIRDQDVSTIATYFGACFDRFDHTAENGGINFNGDDGVELYENMDVIEVYGDVVDDGTGLFWEYTGSWAYKAFGDTYIYGGANCAEFAATNASSACPYAFCE